jgi:hypothetical protein
MIGLIGIWLGEVVMRRAPEVSWSSGCAAIRWPRWLADDAIFYLLYPDQSTAVLEYNRAAAWRHRRGATGRVCTIYLERTPEGQPWLDIGPRTYFAHDPNHFEEPLDQRIAVSVIYAGRNRLDARRRVKQAGEMWLAFAELPEPDEASLKKAFQLLCGGEVPTVPGTKPVQLGGLSTLGKLVRPCGRGAVHVVTFEQAMGVPGHK